MTSRTTVPTTVATPTDPQGTYVTYNYGTDSDAGWSKLLTSITTTETDENNNSTTTTQTIDYDAIGNPKSYLGANMTWFARQLKTYSKDGTTVSYTYDAGGLRATKTVNGTKSTYVYVNGLLTYKKRGNIEIYFWYDSYGHLMALRCFGLQNNNSYYYVLTNIQGDVLGIYNPSGELVVSYEYDTWGNLISMNDTSGVNIGTINPIRYRGYYFDEETSLYYLQSRYYDPQVGRFINVDCVLGGNDNLLSFNLFAYCGNNPINRVDPTGRSFIAIAVLTLLVGGIILGGAGNSSVATIQRDPIDPSVPPPPSSGYVPPKDNPNPGKVPNPNGSGKGWPSDDGGVWVPNNKQHGGPGWTEQFPDGKHRHRYPDGYVRETSPEPINWDPIIGVGLVIAGVVASAYIIVNDITVVGVADDWMLGASGGLITEGGILIFG